MNTRDGEYVDGLIEHVLCNELPDDVERVMRGQLDEFCDRLATISQVATQRSKRRRHRVWLSAAATMAATVVLVVTVIYGLKANVSLADVAAAVLDVPWIHVTNTAQDGTTRDFWYSPTKDISASRTPERAEYRDHQQRIYHVYDFADKILYRVPEPTRRDVDDIQSMAMALSVLLESGQSDDDPLQQLGFLRDMRDELEVVDQKLEKVQDDRRKWFDYHLTVHTSSEEQISFQFRVNPETKLLHQCCIEAHRDGKTEVRESRFDYPEKGPISVHELGVPKTAKLVDRIPQGDLARILEAHRAGRQRMDDYRAFSVESDIDPYVGGVNIIYRKDGKFRRDWGMCKNNKIMRRAHDEGWPQPAAGETASQWWQRNRDDILVAPVRIHTDSTEYQIKWKSAKDSDGASYINIESVVKWPVAYIGHDDPMPTFSYWQPEFFCRPALGVPHEDTNCVLDLNPSDGPPGTILLRTGFVGRMARRYNHLRQEGESANNGQSYWLDPARNYAVVHYGSSGGESKDGYAIDEMAQSPQGIWYVTRARCLNAVQDSNGKKHDQSLDFSVDFAVDLPDSLFVPPRLGRLE